MKPDGVITIFPALMTESVGAAHVGFQEHQLGTLRRGALALSEDPDAWRGTPPC